MLTTIALVIVLLTPVLAAELWIRHEQRRISKHRDLNR